MKNNLKVKKMNKKGSVFKRNYEKYNLFDYMKISLMNSQYLNLTNNLLTKKRRSFKVGKNKTFNLR